MCNPAAVMVAVSIASTVVQSAGQRSQAKAQANAARYRAQVAENNKIIAEQKAQDAILRGRVLEQKKREQTAQLLSQQRVALAGSGQVIDEGSAVDLVEDTAGLGEVDALTIRSNAEREALGFRQQGMNFESEAQLLRTEASNADRAARFAMFTMLTGIGGAGAQGAQNGAFSGLGGGGGSTFQGAGNMGTNGGLGVTF